MERPGEPARERFHLAFLFPERHEQRSARFLGVFAAEPFGCLLLPLNLMPAGNGRDIDGEAIVQERQPGQMGDDARPGALGPAAERQHGMVVSVERETAAGLADTFAVPAVLLDCQRRVEQAGRIVGCPAGEARVEKPPHARAVLGITHRMHWRLRPECSAQRDRKFLELPRQFLQHGAVVVTEAAGGAEVAGVGVDLDGEKHGQMLTAEAAVQDPRPIAGETPVAHRADDRVGHFLGSRVVVEQGLPVV